MSGGTSWTLDRLLIVAVAEFLVFLAGASAGHGFAPIALVIADTFD
nr:hypothetical protein [Mesorhizobium sp.]